MRVEVVCITQQKQNICIPFVQCWTNVEDVGPTLYKWYTNVLRFLVVLRKESQYYCDNSTYLCIICNIIHIAFLAVDYRQNSDMYCAKFNVM